MIKSFRRIYPLYIFTDLILMGISFYVPYLIKYGFDLPYPRSYLLVFSFWALSLTVAFKNKRLYSTNRSLTIPKEIARVVVSVFYTAVLVGAFIFFSKYKFFSRSVFLNNFLFLCVFLSGFRIIKRFILRRLISKGFHNINVLIIGARRAGKLVLEEIEKIPTWGFKVVGFLDDDAAESINGVPVLGKVEDFVSVAKRFFVEEVIVAASTEKQSIADLIKQAKGLHLGVRVAPQDFEEFAPAIDISYLGFIPLISYKERGHHPAEFALKRLFDFLVSTVLLILFFPLFIILAILIKIDSGGPVFYIQKRAGLKGKVFNVYKFRSMVRDAEELKEKLMDQNEVKDGVIFKIKKDPRITGIGRLLRRFSLDELPQLFNVFKGDMSLVGTRPPTPDEVEKYTHEQLQRLSVRPGITGLSQVRGRSELSFKQWVRWDLWYINNWSFGIDIMILWWTIPTVIKGKGAY